jgi:hypothetical protein
MDYAKKEIGALCMKFADGKALIASLGGWPKGDELGQGGFRVILLAHQPTRKVRHAVKPLPRSSNARNLAQDVATCEHLNHPLIIEFEAPTPASGTGEKATATESTPNGSLIDHLPSNPSASPLSLLRGDTRIAIVVAGIVIGIQYLHSRRFIHRDLKSDSILLDWNWIVHMGILVTVFPLMNYNNLLQKRTRSQILPTRQMLDVEERESLITTPHLHLHSSFCHPSPFFAWSFPQFPPSFL